MGYDLSLWSLKPSFAMVLIQGLLLICQSKRLLATSLSDYLRIGDRWKKSNDTFVANFSLGVDSQPTKFSQQINQSENRATTLLRKPIWGLAQLPNPIPPKPSEQPLQSPTNPPAPVELNPPETPSLEDFPAIPGKITVTRFEFEGNTAFSNQELSKTVKQFTNYSPF